MDPQGSEMVYNEQRFTRRGAIPDFALKLLPWNVGNMDGEEHNRRKTLLLETVSVSNGRSYELFKNLSFKLLESLWFLRRSR